MIYKSFRIHRSLSNSSFSLPFAPPVFVMACDCPRSLFAVGFVALPFAKLPLTPVDAAACKVSRYRCSCTHPEKTYQIFPFLVASFGAFLMEYDILIMSMAPNLGTGKGASILEMVKAFEESSV